MNPTHPTVTDDLVTPAATLRGAGMYLLAHGWHQGDMFADPDQPMPAACALGAIRMAVLGSPVVDAALLHPTAVGDFDVAVAAFADHLVEFYGVADPTEVGIDILDGGPEQVVAEWNDATGTIASHVVAALRGAAEQWERIHPPHLGYPHTPGSVYGCPACRAICYCPDTDVRCVHCAIEAEQTECSSTVGGGR